MNVNECLRPSAIAVRWRPWLLGLIGYKKGKTKASSASSGTDQGIARDAVRLTWRGTK